MRVAQNLDVVVGGGGGSRERSVLEGGVKDMGLCVGVGGLGT